MIHIGTSGYSYKDWIGPFYPDSCKSSDMLMYYSEKFDFTEVNSTYYHMPSVNLAKGLDRKTPDHFKFSFKLFGGFTHDRNMLKSDADNFIASLKPVTQSGKMLCILIQFPYSYHYTKENIDYLKRLRSYFDDYEICVEFRNVNWIKKEVFDILKEIRAGYVCVDEPRIKGLIPPVTAVTSEICYIRMHGRNAKDWYGSDGMKRYDYLYSRNELIEWVTKINELKTDAGSMVVAFNNHPIGQAVVNAAALRELLKLKKHA